MTDKPEAATQGQHKRAIARSLRINCWRLPRSIVTAPAFVLVFLLGVLIMGTVVTAVLHLHDPEYWGVWFSSHMFVVGVLSDTSHARELLGYWIYPATVVTVYICWYVGQICWYWALRTVAKR